MIALWAVVSSAFLAPALFYAFTGASAQVGPTWTAQGPGPARGGQVEGMGLQSNPVAGGANAVVPHPSDPNTLWIGAVNGGVWRTNNATASAPTWTPLTDQFPGLSIGALDRDPTDATNQTLLAGIGRFSAIHDSGPLTGVLRTTNGGNDWDELGATALAGRNISGVAARGSVIVVAANDTSPSTGAGLYRSTNTGGTFPLLSGNGTSGLPAGAVYDLVGDPADANRLYAAVKNLGIFRSSNAGETWTNISGTNFGTDPSEITASTNNIELAVHYNAGAGTSALYVGVVNNSRLAHLRRSGSPGSQSVTWTFMDLPGTTEGGTFVGVHPGGQGGASISHFSIVADPANQSVVYLGGDRQTRGAGPNGVYEAEAGDDRFPNSIGATNYTGRLFRCNASLAEGSMCRPVTHNATASNSAPHADSRRMAFDASGDIIEVDDGGVYRLTDPATSAASRTGDWVSLNGDIQITETHSCDYDSLSNIIICGTQDTGASQQTTAGGTTWEQLLQGDGGVVAVDDGGAQSVRYFYYTYLKDFLRQTYSSTNQYQSQASLLLRLSTTGQDIRGVDSNILFYAPYELNAVDGVRMVIGTANVYESSNRGDTLTDLGYTGNYVGALAYGGRSGGVANTSVLYYGIGDLYPRDAGGKLFLRSSAGSAPSQLGTYPGRAPRDIALDPTEWRSAFVIDDDQVFRTDDAGTSWTEMTGNLPALNVGRLRTVSFIGSGASKTVLVGSNAGVFVSPATGTGAWTELGTNLPNAPVMDLRYDATDDVLLAATLGRGAWTIGNASQHAGAATPTPTATSTQTATPTATAKVPDPGCTLYPSTDTPRTINDVTTITSSINVANSFTITDVNVRPLNIAHTYDADLDVFLVSPQGTRVELFTDVGSNGDNFTGTILDDEAANSIATGQAAPFTGRFRPEGSLSALDTQSSAGAWTLEITDDEAQDSGTLTSWQLELCGAAPSTATPTRTSTATTTRTSTATLTATPTHTATPTATAKLPEPGCTLYPSSDTPRTIEDVTTIASSINVANSFIISDVNVRPLNIVHTYDADLDVFLLSPQGTRVELFTDIGSNGDNFTGTILDDEAPDSIDTGQAAPFSGRFRPEGLLSAFDTQNSAGTWTLEVTDDEAQDSGTLTSWQLELCGAAPSTATPTRTSTATPTRTATPTATAKVAEPGCTLYPSTDTPRAIGDVSTITSEINVANSFIISDVNVRPLNIVHTYDADLDVFLVSPQGTRVELFTDVGSNGDNFTATILDDEAPSFIATGQAAPFTGRFRPEGLLSALDTENTAGAWTLEVTDDEAQDTGTLTSWQLELCGAGAPTATPTKQPSPGDTDGDGCTDEQENGLDEVSGGLRDYRNFWDFYDVPAGAGLTRDASISGTDIFAVIGRFNSTDEGPGDFDRSSDPLSTPNPLVLGENRENYHPAYDRGGIIGPNVWNLGAANGAVAGTDIFNVIGQFGHSCA